jgi:hypothetical protein
MKLIVFRVNGEHYLKLTEDYSIHAFKKVEDIMDMFKGYNEYYKRNTGESCASATIGMITLSPQIIEFPFEAKELVNYFLDETPFKLWGGVARSGFFGVKIAKEILTFKIESVWDNIYKDVYGECKFNKRLTIN